MKTTAESSGGSNADNGNIFTKLSAINVNEHTKKKGALTYLSWAWALDQLLRLDPNATWEYRWFGDLPYCRMGETVMVFCTVSAFGISRTAWLPAMDNHNKAIKNPDSFQINTTMQRCLAKAIALHGLGLYIYAGEDLPAEEAEKTVSEEQQVAIQSLLDETGSDGSKFCRFFKVEALSELHAKDYERAVAMLEKKRKEAA